MENIQLCRLEDLIEEFKNFTIPKEKLNAEVYTNYIIQFLGVDKNKTYATQFLELIGVYEQQRNIQ